MTYLQALIFGMVQGITEFLPISSTAHMVITQLLLGLELPGLTFEIFLHQASVLAVIIYFRRDIIEVLAGFWGYLRGNRRENKAQFFFALYIGIATIITGGLGVILKDFVSETMKTPPFIALALVVTGTLLIIIERFHRYGYRTEQDMTFLDSIIVGLGQTLAVLPGISRSGTTLVAALWVGLSRETAVRYSFLLAIPVILGSSVLAIGDISHAMWTDIGFGPLFTAFLATFIFSWIGIVWLISFLKQSRLTYFAIYCFIVAFLVYNFLDASLVF